MKNIKKLNFFKIKKKFYPGFHLISLISLLAPKSTNTTEDLFLGTGISQSNFFILKAEF